MANLPSKHPHLSLHLTDRALTPLITSARTPAQLDALTSLTHAALSGREAALRLGLGAPQRIMVEHEVGGPVLLQSFLSAFPPLPRPTTSGSSVVDDSHEKKTQTNGAGRQQQQDGEHTTTTVQATAEEGEGEEEEEEGEEQQDIPQHIHSNNDDHDNYAEEEEERRRTRDALRNTTARLQQLSVSPTTITPRGVQLGEDQDENEDEDGDEDEGGVSGSNTPPMLVALVVAPGTDETGAPLLVDARRAAARLERVGREVQARWAEVETPGGGGGADRRRQQQESGGGGRGRGERRRREDGGSTATRGG